MGTKFVDVYNTFLGKITDDSYFELTPEDTIKDLQRLLLNAIPYFEFPRQAIDSYTLSVQKKKEEEVVDTDFVIGVIWNDLEEDDQPDDQETPYVLVENSTFTNTLTTEEINILAVLMMDGWLQRQITSIEVTRMKYSGSDFKLTSQANHLAKLLVLKEEVVRQNRHLQRLYKRRIATSDGRYVSNWGVLDYHVADAKQGVTNDSNTSADTASLTAESERVSTLSRYSNAEIIKMLKNVE